MASFTPTLNPSNDPNYLSQSRGYSDVKADQTMGTLLGHVGGLLGEGVKAADKIIQEKALKEPLQADLATIINNKGGNILPDEIPAIAGTGSRGSKFSAVQAGAPVEDVFQEGDGGDALPPMVQRGLKTLDRTKEAYQQGELSDAKFRAEVNVATQKYVNMYPHYADEIRAITANYLSTDTANKEREAVLQAMNGMAAAAGVQQRQNLQYLNSHEAEISYVYPGRDRAWLEQNIEAIKRNPEVQSFIFQKAKAEYTSSLVKSLEGDKKLQEFEANKSIPDIATTVLQGHSKALTGMFGGVDGLVEKINNGTLNNPQAMAGALKSLAVSKAQALTDFDNRLSTNGLIGKADDSLVKAQKERITQHFDEYSRLISEKKFSVATIAAHVNEMRTDLDANQLASVLPDVRKLAALRKFGGDNIVSSEIAQGIVTNPASIKTLLGNSVLSDYDAQTPPRPLPEHIKAAPGGKVSYKDFTSVVDAHKVVLDKASDPLAADKAAHVLFDSTSWFDALRPQRQMEMFSKMTSEETLARVKKLSPEAQDAHFKWVTNAFQSTFKAGASDLVVGAQSRQNSIHLDISGDTPQWVIDRSYPQNELGFGPRKTNVTENRVTGERVPPGQTDAVQRLADPLNYGMKYFWPVLEDKYGKTQAMVVLQNKLIGMGVNANALKPPKEGVGGKAPVYDIGTPVSNFFKAIGGAVGDTLGGFEGGSAYGKRSWLENFSPVSSANASEAQAAVPPPEAVSVFAPNFQTLAEQGFIPHHWVLDKTSGKYVPYEDPNLVKGKDQERVPGKRASTSDTKLAGDVVPLPISPGPNAGKPTASEVFQGRKQNLPRLDTNDDYSRRVRERLSEKTGLSPNFLQKFFTSEDTTPLEQLKLLYEEMGSRLASGGQNQDFEEWVNDVLPRREGKA